MPVTITVELSGTSTSVQRVNAYLDGADLIEDVASPFTFELPTTKFVDGLHHLEVEATLRNGFTTTRASIDLTFSNGNTQPPVNTNTFTIRPGTTPPPGTPFVLAAAGDGAGGRPEADAVVGLIQSWSPNMFAYLGDVYAKGTSTEFHNWYGNAGTKWGSLREITNPVIGNHEYENGSAPGYFDYWDNVPNYYSYDVSGWHVVALNSTSQFDQLAPGSAQYNWLVADLAASSAPCKLAYFHHPVVSEGPQGDTPSLNPIWQLLADAGTDIVLSGHDHQYQRWTPLDRNLVPAAGGITQFVVGGGGHGVQALVGTDSRLVTWADSPTTGVGALRLRLNAAGASYAYINTAGSTLDSGTIGCGTGADITPPSDPGQVGATAIDHTHVNVSWTASTDDVAVAGYTIVRNGVALTDVATAPTVYNDATALPQTTYTYGVQAFDAAGNRSAVVNAAPVTTPATPAVLNFAANADSYVSDSAPTTNYGTANLVRVDASPIQRSYLRFSVSGLTAPPASVKLRVLANSASSVGYR
ncbi:MAG: metallophosphoesterase, partial [Acidimicrobiia bacterium]|nr:metallophosphoesterase [Acidimicrobiia bacterium]